MNSSIMIALATLGCKVNQCDSAAMCEALEAQNYTFVPFTTTADVYIINTCVVTASTEAQCRQFIRRARKANPSAQVLVTGCYAQKSCNEILSVADRVHVLGNHEKNNIAAYMARIVAGNNPVVEVSDIACEKCFTTPAASHFFDRTRAFLKIQDGCNSRCSYCIVPSVRGHSRSLPVAEVTQRLHLLAGAGYREIVLTGIHLGAYGIDLSPPTRILDLLESIEHDPALSSARIRLSSFEPKELSREIIHFIAQSKRVCPHLHIPLQSGDSGILKLMKRPYSPGFFKELIDTAVAGVPDVNIGIDVIVGFPGETDEQFNNTVRLIESLPAGYLHVFPYSPRPATPAADFPDQVPGPVKKQRAAVLRRLSLQKKQSFYAMFCGRPLSLIPEAKRDNKTGLLRGFSRNYIPVLFEGPDALIGKEVRVLLARAEGGAAYGTLGGMDND